MLLALSTNKFGVTALRSGDTILFVQLLIQVKKDFAIEGLSCSNSATIVNLLKYSNHGENQSYHYWCSRV